MLRQGLNSLSDNGIDVISILFHCFARKQENKICQVCIEKATHDVMCVALPHSYFFLPVWSLSGQYPLDPNRILSSDVCVPLNSSVRSLFASSIGIPGCFSIK